MASLSTRARLGLRVVHLPMQGAGTRCFMTVRDGQETIEGLPAKRGLYDPLLEKDSCGTGFICQIDGKWLRAL